MPPPGYEPFLHTICANPEDDTVRLVYADWLDENGDEDRAEFVRCQIASRVAGDHPKNPTFRRARWLLKEHSAKWRAELPSLKAIDWAGFERGFINRVSVRSDTRFSKNLATAFTLAPIEQIQLCNCRPWMIHQLLTIPEFGRVRRLEAHSGYVDDGALAALATSSAASGLEAFNLPCETWATTANGRERIPQVTDRGAEALARSASLVRLDAIWLPKSDITANGWALLKERYRLVSSLDWNW